MLLNLAVAWMAVLVWSSTLIQYMLAQRRGHVSDSAHDNDERRLVDHLFMTYDSELRPVLRKHDVITVTFGLSLHQIIDVQEKSQIVIISVWARQVWYNSLLSWNQTEFGGIKSFNIDPSRVWKPDLYLYNNADEGGDGSLDRFKTKIVISSDGRNMWLAPVILRSSCKMNVKWFPFDEQLCKLKFGSWTYDGYKLDLLPEEDAGETKKFVNNGEWDLVGLPCERNEILYVCCPEPYPDITFTLTIRRRTMFYYVNLIIPCFLITGLTLLSFFLPPESGERIALVITNLLALTVFMLLVAEILPPSSEVIPLISIYYSGTMFEVGLSLVATCLVLKCHFRNPSLGDMPSWLRILVLDWLARLLRIPVNPESRKYSAENRSHMHETSTTLCEEDKLHDASQRTVLLNNTVKSPRTSNGYLPSSPLRVPTSLEVANRVLKRHSTNIPLGRTPSSYKLSDTLEDEVFESNLNRVTSSPGMSHNGDVMCTCNSENCIRIYQQQEELIKYVRIISNFHEEKEEDQAKKEEWEIAATIIDSFSCGFSSPPYSYRLSLFSCKRQNTMTRESVT